MRIDVVGPCASGKSLLVDRLRADGYDAHQCSQEHSDIPDMWCKFCRPDLLVYLDASFETIAARRGVSWGAPRLAVLQSRLAHARAHCDLYISTDGLTPEAVARRVLDYLEKRDWVMRQAKGESPCARP